MGIVVYLQGKKSNQKDILIFLHKLGKVLMENCRQVSVCFLSSTDNCMFLSSKCKACNYQEKIR